MHVMSVKPGMSHLPWPSMRRAPAGSLAGVPAVIDAIRPFSSVTVARASGTESGVIGNTVTSVMTMGAGGTGGAAWQLAAAKSSNADSARDMDSPRGIPH